MYGNKYNVSSIKSKSNATVFNEVIEVSGYRNPPYYENSSCGGVTNGDAAAYIMDVFSHKYNKNVLVNEPAYATYENIKSVLSSSNKLLYMMLGESSSHPYGKHALVGYAYTRLKNVGGSYVNFMKVCDGLASSARYLAVSAIQTNPYWAVCF